MAFLLHAMISFVAIFGFVMFWPATCGFQITSSSYTSPLKAKASIAGKRNPYAIETALLVERKSFGEQQYWESWYKNRSSIVDEPGWSGDQHQQQNSAKRDDVEKGDFSWYASWEDLRPFVQEFGLQSKTERILLPGIGMDSSLIVDMYQKDGYTNLVAMDYAPASIEYIRQRWKQQQLSPSDLLPNLELDVADVRKLPYSSESFDAVLDKGTLDAVFLCGNSPEEKRNSLHRGVIELQRVLRPGGLFWSLSGVCMDLLGNEDWWPNEKWECCVDTARDSLYTTVDGYTSNNVDGSLLVWRKK